MNIDENTLKPGDKLIHPVHGPMTVTRVGPQGYEEIVFPANERKTGRQIEARFNRLIRGVKWSEVVTGGQRVSKLVFHSYYLRNLKKG